MNSDATTLRDISTKLGKKESALRECLYATLFEAVVGKTEKQNESLRVLDIGCGRGELLRLLQEAGQRPFGLDVEPDCVDISRQFANAELGGFDDLASLFPTPDFDAVVCSHVIEHVDDPLRCLKQAHQLDAECYVFAVPNVHRSIRLLRAIGSSERPDHPTHVFGWGKPEFNALLQRAGFEVINWHHDRVTINPFAGSMGTWLTHCLGPLETKFLPWLFPGLSSSLIAECRSASSTSQ